MGGTCWEQCLETWSVRSDSILSPVRKAGLKLLKAPAALKFSMAEVTDGPGSGSGSAITNFVILCLSFLICKMQMIMIPAW